MPFLSVETAASGIANGGLLFRRKKQHGLKRALSIRNPPRKLSILDVIHKDAPPHIAVRYGDVVRLYCSLETDTGAGTASPPPIPTNTTSTTDPSNANVSLSKVSSCSQNKKIGRYIGTYDVGKPFLHSVNPNKEGELACFTLGGPQPQQQLPLFRESYFRVFPVSEDRIIGTPVSYGDVIVLVDPNDKVWNNKIGVGPTSLNGYFGPRQRNISGEMYVSFMQQSTTPPDEQQQQNGSDLIDFALDEVLLPIFGRTLSTTKCKMDEDAVGKVVYYGDANVVIDVADSNRLRSGFNRVITYYHKKKHDTADSVAYLRCDGKGKILNVQIHGSSAPSIESFAIDTNINVCPDIEKTRQIVASGVEFRQYIRVQGPQHAKLTILFDDKGEIQIPFEKMTVANSEPFYKIVYGGKRIARIQIHASPVKLTASNCALRKHFIFGDSSMMAKYSTNKHSHLLLLLLTPTLTIGIWYSIVLTCFQYWNVDVFKIVVGSMSYFAILFKVFHSIHGNSMAENLSKQTITLSSNANSTNTVMWEVAVLAWESSFTERVEGFNRDSANGNHNLSTTTTSSSSSDTNCNSSILVKNVPANFLVAESNDCARALERYESTLKWRLDHGTDTILTVPQQNYQIIKKYYKQCVHKRDKLGHPVYIEKIGSIDLKQLKQSNIQLQDLFQHYLFNIEFVLKYVAPNICPCPSCVQSETQKLVIILDTRGIGMRDLGGETLEFIKKCTSMMQNHYPQRSFKICIINVPSWFNIVWKCIKPLLNETTKEKTMIVSEAEVAATLLEIIPPENLPTEYGGTCQCEGGCFDHSNFQKMQLALVNSVLNPTADNIFDPIPYQSQDPYYVNFNTASHKVVNGFISPEIDLSDDDNGLPPSPVQSTSPTVSEASNINNSPLMSPTIELKEVDSSGETPPTSDHSANFTQVVGIVDEMLENNKNNSNSNSSESSPPAVLVAVEPVDDISGESSMTAITTSNDITKTTAFGLPILEEINTSHKIDGNLVKVKDVGIPQMVKQIIQHPVLRGNELKKGYLLMRSVKHKHFNPIWLRRYFILSVDFIRFGKHEHSEIFQMFQISTDTVIKKLNKPNCFEVMTPQMMANGHSLLLYAETSQLQCEWMEAFQLAIEKDQQGNTEQLEEQESSY